MKNIEFNLIDEPWIRVALIDGQVEEKSLINVLCNAHRYRGLAGEMTAQDVVVLRMLAALVHVVFTRVDESGTPSPVSKSQECIRRWKSLWDLGYFYDKPIENYLNQWRDRFWLFHPERPFYQVPRATIGTKNTAGKLNGAVSESNNKIRLFSQASGIGKKTMTYAESARWLLFLNGFDDCAAKQADKSDGSRSFTVGWLGKLGLIYAVGSNLFETIMLNMPMLHDADLIPWTEDVPTWELENVRDSERETIRMPDSLAGLYTLQSRRILLERKDNLVTGYSLLGGDAFDDMNALGEPMTIWRIIQDKKTAVLSYKPLLHLRSRYIWRDFSALTASSDGAMKPGIVSWCDLLREKKILPRKRVQTFGVVCVRYDSSQSSSITDSFADDVTFHIDILSDSGKYWREEIIKQIEKIDKAAWLVGELVCKIRRSEGLDSKQDDAPTEEAKQAFYYDIDRVFRRWLVNIDADQDAEERNIVAVELEKSIRTVALRIGRQLVEKASPESFIGRAVSDKKQKAKQHYSAPQAFLWFRKNIWKLYPIEKGGIAVEEEYSS